MSGFYFQEGPVIDLDANGNESLRGPREKYPALITDLDQKARECQVFADGAAHNMCAFTVMPGRTIEIRTSIRCHDNTGAGRFAFLDDILFVSRVGAAAPALVGGGAGVLGFSPNAAPFNTILAVPALSGNDVVYTVTGLAGVSLRWTVAFVIVGSQAK